jgi:hypothetical protein
LAEGSNSTSFEDSDYELAFNDTTEWPLNDSLVNGTGTQPVTNPVEPASAFDEDSVGNDDDDSDEEFHEVVNVVILFDVAAK